MKFIYIFWVLVIFSAGERLKAQSVEDSGIEVREFRAEKKGDELQLVLVLDGEHLNITSNEELNIIPAVVCQNGDTLKLPAVVFPGKKREKVNRRKARLYGGNPGYYETFYSVPEGETLAMYNYTLPFENRMYGAQLVLLQSISGCADCRRDLAAISLRRLGNRPKVAYIVPEAVTDQEVDVAVFIHFPWDKSQIFSTFMNNEEELSKIDRALELILNNPNVVLTDVRLVGYASPEGAYAYNSRLAARRAEAVKGYVKNKYPVEENILVVESVPEDWAGVRSRVDSSALVYRSDILDIIDHTPDPDARDGQLRRLDNNVSYHYLLNQVYPVLRRVDCRMNYTIQEPYTLEEIQQLLETHPDRLSLNELFLASRVFLPGSDDFNRVFMVAGQLFPEDEVVNVNCAASALQADDLETARKCLAYANRFPEAWNNLGILFLAEGRIPEAVRCFEDACAGGCPEAEYNLHQAFAHDDIP